MATQIANPVSYELFLAYDMLKSHLTFLFIPLANACVNTHSRWVHAWENC